MPFFFEAAILSRDQVAVRLSNMTPCLIGNRKGTA